MLEGVFYEDKNYIDSRLTSLHLVIIPSKVKPLTRYLLETLVATLLLGVLVLLR